MPVSALPPSRFQAVSTDLSHPTTGRHLALVLFRQVGTGTYGGDTRALLASELRMSPLAADAAEGVCLVQNIGKGREPVAGRLHLCEQLPTGGFAGDLEDD